MRRLLSIYLLSLLLVASAGVNAKNSRNRHDDIGIDNKTIKANVKSIISDNRSRLYEGDNTIKVIINGIPKLIRVNIFQGQIRSYNFMPCDGVNIRSTRPVINLPNQNW